MNPSFLSHKNRTAFSVAGNMALWLFFAYLYVQILHFHQSDITNPILAGMYLVLFGVHEASHILFAFLPSVLTAVAGSFGEIAFSTLVVIAALRAKSHSATVFGLLWLALALMSAGNYMADAKEQLMPLIGPGPEVTHDWNFVFGELGWLGSAEAIGGAVKTLGRVIGAASLLFGFSRIFKSAPNRREHATIG